MDWIRTDYLVEKYWEGETTVEEERELKRFFRLLPPDVLSGPLSAPRREAANLFRYYAAAETEQPLGKAFDARLLRQLEARPFAPSTQWGWLVNPLRVAACLLMVIATVLVSRHEYRKAAETRRTELETYDDPRRAYEETKKALLLISVQLNAGKAYAGEIRKISEAEAKVRSNTIDN